MVMLVTEKGPLRRRDGLYAIGRPKVHVALFKSAGQSLLCSWAARNEGGAAGSAYLSLLNVSPAWTASPFVATSTLVTISPGITVNLLLTVFNLLVGTHVLNGLNTMRLDMYKQNGQLIQIHDFPLTIG